MSQPSAGGRGRRGCAGASRPRARPGARRCHAAAGFPERRHLARQLRRAGARGRPRDFLDADGDDAESAAAPRQPADRSRRLGSHQPLRGRRARLALRQDAGRRRLRRALESGGDDVEPGGAHARPGAAARDRRGGAADACRLAGEPLRLPQGGSAADAGDARRGDRRPARGARQRPVRPHPDGVRRSADGFGAAAAAADQPRESIEQVLAAARAVDTPVERTSLLATVVAIDRSRQGRRCPPTGPRRREPTRPMRSASKSSSTVPTGR